VVLRALLVTLLVAGAGIYARVLASSTVASPGIPELAVVDPAPSGWQSRDLPMGEEVQDVLRADAWLFRNYVRGDGAIVNVFVGYFADQSVGSQIHSPRNCLPGSGWNILRVDAAGNLAGGSCSRMAIEREGERRDVVYWFRTRSGRVVGEYSLKFDLVRNSLGRRPTDAAFIRFMSVRDDGTALRELAETLVPEIDAALAGIGL
jgi:EpsI family protein